MRRATMAFLIVSLAALTGSCDRETGGGAPGAGKTAAGSTDRMVFDIGHVVNTDHPMHKAVEKFAEEIERRSGGAMAIKIHPEAALGDEQKMCDDVSKDVYAFTKISWALVGSKAELAKVFTLPYLFRDEEHAWRALEGPIGREMLDVALDQNLKGICHFDAGARSFYTKKRVVSPEDLKGLKIRVPKSPMMQRIVESLGASPQDVAFGDLYKALESGRLDAAENNIPSYFTERHYEVAPFYVYDEHVCVPDVILMSAKRWNALTPEQRNIIEESAKVAVAFERDLWKRSCEENRKKMEEAGVTFTRLEDKTAFVEATKEIYDEFRGTEMMDLVERIRAVE